nr:unnamed protein product [Spirometra erinaceieuropaei]
MSKDTSRVQYIRRSSSAPPECGPSFQEPRPSILQQIRDSAMTFFGLSVDKSQEDWNSRRLRYLLKKYGNIKPAKLVSSLGGDPPNTNFEGAPTGRPTLGRQVSLLTQLGTPAPLSPCVITRRNSALKALGKVVRLSAARRKRRINASPFQNGALHLPAGSLYSPPPQTSLVDGSPFDAENWVGLVETPGLSLPQLSVIPTPKSAAPAVDDEGSRGPINVAATCSNIPLIQLRHGRKKLSLHETVENSSVHLRRHDSRANSNFVNEGLTHRTNYVSAENVISETRSTSLPHRPRYFFPSSTTTMSSRHSRCAQSPRLGDMLADFDMESQPSVAHASLLVRTEPSLETTVPLRPKAVPASEVSELPPLSRLDSLRPPPLTLPSQSAPFAPDFPQALCPTTVPSPSAQFTSAILPPRITYTNRQSLRAFEHGYFSPTLQALNIETYSPGFAAFIQQCRDKARGVGTVIDVNISNRKQGRSSSSEERLPPTASLPATPFFYKRLKRLKSSSSSVTTSPQATPFLPAQASPARPPPSRAWRPGDNFTDKTTPNATTAFTNKRPDSTTGWWTLHRKFRTRKMTCLPARNRETEMIYQSVDQSLLDYRPYFTYFVSFVQVVILIVACAGYGFAPVGLNMEHEVAGEILLSSLVVERVCRIEDENLWVGPRQADLIRIGARYSPCMRTDTKLRSLVIDAQKTWDRKSGCCVRNDGEGCHQTSRLTCPRTTSTWLRHQTLDFAARWPITDQSTSKNGRKDRGNEEFSNQPPSKIGPVCGLDPEFCEEPRSTGPFAWSQTDVTEWPICHRSVNVSLLRGYAEHMQCEVIARPCCVGVKGECIITTVAHCAFLRGQYHADASLCSQVNCLEEVCGMMPFLRKGRPDQLYRIYLSLFLHAGVIHLALSLIIQLLLMRNLEKLLGWLRVALIYILSGCFSSLASGIMLPYHVHTGPTGAHFALFGVVFVDYLQTHDIFASPWTAILQQVLSILGVLFVGFLPWLDNYAHVSGFISGVLLSYVFVPYLGFGCAKLPSGPPATDESTTRKRRLISLPATFNATVQSEYSAAQLEDLLRRMKRRRLKVVLCCSLLWVALFITLLVVFLHCPLTSCAWCKYLNCLPWTQSMCDTLEVNVHAPTRCIHPHA